MNHIAKILAATAALMMLAACSQAPPPVADTREADAKAVREAEARTNGLLAQKDRDLDKIAMFWADDASLMIPDVPNVKGNPAIKAFLKDMLADPNFSLKFASDTVEVAKSSDLAYSQGTYTLTVTDSKTKKVLTEKGKFATVFKKQADGSWRAVADINNADAPAAVEKK